MQSLETQIKNKKARVGVVGFGYIGTCIGAVLAEQGYQVFGIDVRKKHVDEINSGTTSIAEPGLKELIASTVAAGRLSATTDFSVISDCDVIVVTVGTPLGANYDPDTRDITAASASMAKYVKPHQLIVLKSTVPPGTTEEVVLPELRKKLKDDEILLSFCPERLAEGRALHELRTVPVVVGGLNGESARLSSYFWTESLGVETVIVDGCKAAELVKLACNLWIDLNVALANEMALLSSAFGADALQVISAANTLPKGQGNVNILHPSLGVGGYCLTKDPWFVHHIGKQKGLDLLTPVASRKTNDRMPLYTFELLKKMVESRGKTLAESKVVVLGISFKNNTGDCRFTPTKPILEQLEKSGCQLAIYDPWVNDEEAQTVTKRNLERDIFSALRGADAVAFFTGHDEFKNLTVSKLKELVNPGAAILDGRNFFLPETIREARSVGFVYRGIGRQ